MNCIIPRSFQKDPWKKLNQTDENESLSTKSLLDTKGQREIDTQKTAKRKNLSIVRNNLSPTVLGRLILDGKYEAALRRLKKSPREASIWVIGGSNHGSIRSRQLPIHMACSGLSSSRLENDPSRIQLELLVRQLALVFPGGCAQRDHEQRLPLHEALRCDASLDIISLLLIAVPVTIDEADRYGRLPYEINCERMGDHKDGIAQILRKDKQFWRSKRDEFYAQLHCSSETYTIKNFSRLQCVLGGRPVRNENVTIQSQENELPTPRPFDDKTRQLVEHSDKKIPPKISSKSYLGENGDDSLKMMQGMSRLQAWKAEYATTRANENLARRVIKLEKEKSEMRLRIDRMINLLKTHGLAPGGARCVRLPSKSDVQAMAEENRKNTRYGEHFENPVLVSKAFGKEKHRSSRHRTLVNGAMKEEAKRDILFVPNNYANGSHSGVPPPGTAFERGQLANNVSPHNQIAQRSYGHMDVEAQDNLENLLDLAEQRFGHTFSPGTIQAWRQISLPDPAKQSCGSSCEWVPFNK